MGPGAEDLRWPARLVGIAEPAAASPLGARRMAPRPVRTDGIVQRGIRERPQGPCYARVLYWHVLGFGLRVHVHGAVVKADDIVFRPARWMGREQIVGWNFRHGCSIGRLALTTSF